VQFHRVEPHLNALATGAPRDLVIGPKTTPTGGAGDWLHLMVPGLALAVIDLTKVQHLSLHHLATGSSAYS